MQARHRFEFYRDEKQEYRMRIVSENGNVILASTESYKNLYDCEASFDSVVKTIQTGLIKKEWVNEDGSVVELERSQGVPIPKE